MRPTHKIAVKFAKWGPKILNIVTNHNRVKVFNLFSSLGGIFHTSLPGECAERVVKSRKHPELTLPVLRYCY